MLIALQIGGIAVFLGAALSTYAALSRLALRTAAPVAWIRRLLITFLPLAGVAYLLFRLVGFGRFAREGTAAVLAGAVPSAVGSLLGDLAAQLALFLPTAGVVLAAYAVVVPAIRDARGIELPTRTAVRRVGRYLGALAVLSAVLFVPFLRIVAGEDAGLTPLAFVLLVAGLPAASPVLFRTVRSTRRPTESERTRIEARCGRAGLDVTDVRILADADETLEIHVRGLPGRRRLFLAEFALTAFDDETLTALLASNAGRVAHRYRAIKHGPLYAYLVVAVAALAWGSPWTYAALIALAVLLPLPVLWAARRAVRRADDDAAARVGRETLADALERTAAVQNVAVQSGGFATVFRSRPPLGERIDRLRTGE